MKVTDKITITNEDNMLLMARYPDNYFDLAIVDPPYGIDRNGMNMGNSVFNKDNKKWDSQIPSKQYFKELFRVSQKQIIWGGNYFTNLLSPNRCWICWNKDNPATNFSSIELAWTSFDLLPNYFYYAWGGLSDGIKGRNKKEKSIHPTQKPIQLYEWILKEYAKEGNLILDTHIGSGSSRIACQKNGFNFTGFEIDSEMYKKQNKRYDDFVSQLRLF